MLFVQSVSLVIVTTYRTPHEYKRRIWPNQTLERMTTALGVIGESGRWGRGSHALSFSFGELTSSGGLPLPPVLRGLLPVLARIMFLIFSAHP